MLAAGIVQNTFARETGEGEGGEEETTGGYFYCYFYCSGWNSSLAIELLSQTLTRHVYQKRIYVYIHIYK